MSNFNQKWPLFHRKWPNVNRKMLIVDRNGQKCQFFTLLMWSVSKLISSESFSTSSATALLLSDADFIEIIILWLSCRSLRLSCTLFSSFTICFSISAMSFSWPLILKYHKNSKFQKNRKIFQKIISLIFTVFCRVFFVVFGAARTVLINIRKSLIVSWVWILVLF